MVCALEILLEHLFMFTPICRRLSSAHYFSRRVSSAPPYYSARHHGGIRLCTRPKGQRLSWSFKALKSGVRRRYFPHTFYKMKAIFGARPPNAKEIEIPLAPDRAQPTKRPPHFRDFCASATTLSDAFGCLVTTLFWAGPQPSRAVSPKVKE